MGSNKHTVYISKDNRKFKFYDEKKVNQTPPHSLRTLAGRLSCGVFKMVGDGIQAVEVPISGQSV